MGMTLKRLTLMLVIRNVPRFLYCPIKNYPWIVKYVGYRRTEVFLMHTTIPPAIPNCCYRIMPGIWNKTEEPTFMILNCEAAN